jgi:hypothetical protein
MIAKAAEGRSNEDSRRTRGTRRTQPEDKAKRGRATPVAKRADVPGQRVKQLRRGLGPEYWLG